MMTTANKWNYEKKGIVPRDLVEWHRITCKRAGEGYYNFFRLLWHVVEQETALVDNWHIQYLCERLYYAIERVAKGLPKEKDIIICIPPRCSKSSISTVFLNAWAWTIWPNIDFLTCSYSSGLSEQHSISTKTIIDSPFYKARWGDKFKLSAQKNTNLFFINDKGGQRFSTSVGGVVTGAGGDILIFDDLVSVQDAHSEAKRKRAISMYKNTLYNRVNNPSTGLRILIQQRTHENDVVGHVLREHPDRYELIQLPARLCDGKVFPEHLEENYRNGYLEPIRLGKLVIEDYEETIIDYPAQYGQTPVKPGGNIIKPEWFFEYNLEELFYRIDKSDKKIVFNFELDGAFTSKSSNDPSASIAYCYMDGRLYIRDRFKARYEMPMLLKKYPDFLRKNGYTSSSVVNIEPKANGLDLVPMLVEHCGINARKSFEPTLDKVARAWSVTAFLSSGRVGVPKGASWLSDFYRECEAFPDVDHDDQVDCLVQMIKNGAKPSGVIAWG